MSRKEDNKLSPETRVNLLCALAVLVLCLLLSGDMIVSHFIPVHPNDNYVKEKEFEKREEEGNPSDNNYDVSYMESISLLSLLEKIEQKDTIFIFSGKSKSPPCQKFSSVLKEVKEQIEIKIYYLDQNEISEHTDGYELFLTYSSSLQDLFRVTPYFMVFQNGKYQGEVIGMRDNLKEELVYFVSQYL